MPIKIPQINEKILLDPELNSMERNSYRDAHEAYFMAIGTFHEVLRAEDSGHYYAAEKLDEILRSDLDTALTVVFESKQKLGHLTIYHPLFRNVAGMDLMLQKILSDNFPSKKAKAELGRMLEFHIAKYGDSGISEMVII